MTLDEALWLSENIVLDFQAETQALIELPRLGIVRGLRGLRLPYFQSLRLNLGR